MSRHLERGFLLLDLRRFADAAGEFARAAVLSGEDGAVGRAALAFTSLRQDRVAEAARHVRSALATAPDHPAVLIAAAALEIRTHRPDRARTYLADARRHLPNDPEILGLSALGECVSRDPRAALAFAEHGLAVSPDDALCLECAANASHDLGDSAGRDRYLDRLRAAAPLNAAADTIAAREALGGDDLPAARAHLAEALRLDPENWEAHEIRLRLAASDHPVYRLVAGRIGRWQISAGVRITLCFAPFLAVILIGLSADSDPFPAWINRALNPFVILGLAFAILLGWHAWWILVKGFGEPLARRLGRALDWHLTLPVLCAGALGISQLIHIATGASVAGLAFFALFLCGTWHLGIDRPRGGLFRMPGYAWLHVTFLALAVLLQIAVNAAPAGWPGSTLLGLNLAAFGAFLLLAPPATSATPPPLPSAPA